MPLQNEVSPALLLCRNTVCSSAGAGTRSGTFTNEVEERLQMQQRLPAGTRPLFFRFCERCSCDNRVLNACSRALMRCARYARAAAAGMLKSKEELDRIHASRCNSEYDDDAGHATKSTKCSSSPQPSTPSIAAAPSKPDYAPARAEGLHSNVERAIAIAKSFARNTCANFFLHHNPTEAVVDEGCRVRVQVL